MTAERARIVGVRGLVLPPGLFRLLLAAAVLLSHLSRFDVGRLAVLLFFYLSGYWVTRVWQAKFGPRATLRFYAARYLRIAPLYLLTLTPLLRLPFGLDFAWLDICLPLAIWLILLYHVMRQRSAPATQAALAPALQG